MLYSRSGSRNGTYGRSTASTMPSIVVVSPRPIPSEKIATVMKPGLRRRERKACVRSRMGSPTQCAARERIAHYQAGTRKGLTSYECNLVRGDPLLERAGVAVLLGILPEPPHHQQQLVHSPRAPRRRRRRRIQRVALDLGGERGPLDG